MSVSNQQQQQQQQPQPAAAPAPAAPQAAQVPAPAAAPGPILQAPNSNAQAPQNRKPGPKVVPTCGCKTQPCVRHGGVTVVPRICPWKLRREQVDYLYDIGIITKDQKLQFKDDHPGDPHSHPVAATIRNYAERLMHTYVQKVPSQGVIVDVGGCVERNQGRVTTWTMAPEMISKDSVANGLRALYNYDRWCTCPFNRASPGGCCDKFKTWLNGRNIKAFLMVDVIYYLQKEDIVAMCQTTPIVLSYSHIFEAALGQKCCGEISYRRNGHGTVSMSVSDGAIVSYTHDPCDWLMHRCALVGDFAIAWEPKYSIGKAGDQTVVYRFALTNPEFVVENKFDEHTDPFSKTLFSTVDLSGRPSAITKMDPTWMDVSNDPIYSAGEHFVVTHSKRSMIAPKEVVARVAFHVAGLPRDEKTWQSAISHAKTEYRKLNMPITDSTTAASVTVAAALGYLYGFTLDEAVLDHVIGNSYDLERKQVHAERTANFRPITTWERIKILYNEWVKPKLPYVLGGLAAVGLGIYFGSRNTRPERQPIQISYPYPSWKEPYLSDTLTKEYGISEAFLWSGIAMAAGIGKKAFPSVPWGSLSGLALCTFSRTFGEMDTITQSGVVSALFGFDCGSTPNGPKALATTLLVGWGAWALVTFPHEKNPWCPKRTDSPPEFISFNTRAKSNIVSKLLFAGAIAGTAWLIVDHVLGLAERKQPVVMYNDCFEHLPLEPLSKRKKAKLSLPLDLPACRPQIVAQQGGPVHSLMQPYYPRSCVHNELVSLHNRHLKETPEPDDDIWDEMKEEILEVWGPKDGWKRLPRTSEEEWIKRFPAPRRKMLEPYRTDISKTKFTVDFFVKTEKLEKVTAPRGISGTNLLYQVRTGPLTYDLSKYICTLTHDGPISYTSGWLAEDLSEWANVQLTKGKVLRPYDASKFDAHTGVQAIEYEMAVYEHFGVVGDDLVCLECQTKVTGVTKFGIRFCIKCIRSSGVGNTSGGNSTLSIGMGHKATKISYEADTSRIGCAVNREYFAKYGEVEGIVLGDDTLYGVPKRLVQLFDATITEVYTRCGYKATTSLGRPDYCSGFFWAFGEGVRFGPKIGRCLLKTFWIEMNEFSAERCALAALSLLYQASFLPILRVMAKVVLDFRGTPEGGCKDHKIYQRHLAECTPETMSDVCEHYALTIEEVRIIEEWILDNGAFCDFSKAPTPIRLAVERMILVDCPEYVPKH